MKNALIHLIVLISSFSTAQTWNLSWATKLSGANEVRVYASTIDDAGNVISIGTFQGIVDFDPSPNIFFLTSNGGNDIFVIKQDLGGNLLWAKSFGGIGNDGGFGVDTDDSLNIFITGNFENVCDFDPGLGIHNSASNGSLDMYVEKLDLNGNFKWVKTIGGNGWEDGTAITLDKSGDVLITGRFNSSNTDFNPGSSLYLLSPNGSWDVFLIKLGQDGGFKWAIKVGGADTDIGYSVSTDSNNNVVFGGEYKSTVDFNPGLGVHTMTANGATDAFICKVDVSGQFLWAKSFGGNSTERVRSLVSDSIGNIYSTGGFESVADFDPSPGVLNLTSGGSMDIFVLKLNQLGALAWVKQFSGPLWAWGRSIDIDNYGNVYTSGEFKGTVDFDPSIGVNSITSIGDFDAYLLKLSSTGSYLWAKSYGGIGEDLSFSIDYDKINLDLVASGWFSDTVDFDSSNSNLVLSSSGGLDGFVTRFNQCSDSFDTIAVTACNSFVSPSRNNTWLISGNYNDTLKGVFGCDSVLNVNLTITTIDTGITVSGNTLSSNATGVTYQWLNCDSSSMAISGAVLKSFTPLRKGSYSVVVDNGNCTDTTKCVELNSIGLSKIGYTGIEIFPNPAKNMIQIVSVNNNGLEKIDLFNLTGEHVFTLKVLGNHSANVLMPNPKGVYLLVITTSEGEVIKRVVVKE